MYCYSIWLRDGSFEKRDLKMQLSRHCITLETFETLSGDLSFIDEKWEN